MAPCDTLDVLKSMFVVYIQTTALFVVRLCGKQKSGIHFMGIASAKHVCYSFGL